MEAIGLSQARLAELIGSKSARGIQENVAGKTAPGGNVLGGLVRAGISANWLLTETGPMLLQPAALKISEQVAEYRVAAPSASAPEIDMARLQLAIATVEEALEQTRRTATPDRKAELVVAVYDLYQEPTTSRERVLKLVKLAA